MVIKHTHSIQEGIPHQASSKVTSSYLCPYEAKAQFPANHSESTKKQETYGKSKRTNNYNQTQSSGPSLAFSCFSVHTHLSLGKAQESIAETMPCVFKEFWVWVVTHEYDSEVKVKGWWERQSQPRPGPAACHGFPGGWTSPWPLSKIQSESAPITPLPDTGTLGMLP